jgi:hypothetical protein
MMAAQYDIFVTMKAPGDAKKWDKHPKVGIFFFVEGTILIDAVLVEEGESYGDAIQHGGHHEFWERLTPRTLPETRFKSRAYDAYPRGRVVYFPDKNKYVIYHDACLRHKELKIVAEKFGLEDSDMKLDRDEHYKCARCNPHFMD